MHGNDLNTPSQQRLRHLRRLVRRLEDLLVLNTEESRLRCKHLALDIWALIDVEDAVVAAAGTRAWERRHHNGWLARVERVGEDDFQVIVATTDGQWEWAVCMPDCEGAMQIADAKVPAHDCRCTEWAPRQ